MKNKKSVHEKTEIKNEILTGNWRSQIQAMLLNQKEEFIII